MGSAANDNCSRVRSGQFGPGGSRSPLPPGRWTGLVTAWRHGREPGPPVRLPRIRLWMRGLLVGLVGACVVLPGLRATSAGMPAPTARAPVQAPHPAGPPSEDPPSAEITFATLKRFAILTERDRGRQRLYAVGDTLLNPADPLHAVTLQQIGQARIRVRDSRTQRDVWIAAGDGIPGLSDRRYTRTVSLRAVEYQYVATIAPRDPEARVQRIQDERALLVLEVPPAPRSRRAGTSTSDLAALERVRITEASPNTYDINRAELRDALDQGGRQLAQEWPRVEPLLSLSEGLSLQVKSPLAEGRLSTRGFELTNPRLAGRAGLEVGDVIVAINGQSVNSPGDLYTLYRQAMSSPLSNLEIRLERNGTPITKVYRIR
jgi:hypothetical protein